MAYCDSHCKCGDDCAQVEDHSGSCDCTHHKKPVNAWVTDVKGSVVYHTIPKIDYYKLLGLMTLAKENNKALQAIERAAAKILDEPSVGLGSLYFGHVSDTIYTDQDVDALLEKLEVRVGE